MASAYDPFRSLRSFHTASYPCLAAEPVAYCQIHPSRWQPTTPGQLPSFQSHEPNPCGCRIADFEYEPDILHSEDYEAW